MYEPADTRHGHAIREAVFLVVLSAPPSGEQIRAFLEFGKKELAAELPAAEEYQIGIPMTAGPGRPDISMTFGAGASLQAFKQDGTLAWRLMVQQNQVVVNCLDYERWETVWPRAKGYLQRACTFFVDEEHQIGGASLQYINAFHWMRPEVLPDLTSLLRVDSDRIPRAFWAHRSKEWHLHQGWFDEVGEPEKGRILSREHLTSQTEQKAGLTVLVDLLARYDFSVRFTSAVEFFEERSDPVFDDCMRRLVLRPSLRNYLNNAVLDRIGAKALS